MLSSESVTLLCDVARAALYKVSEECWRRHVLARVNYLVRPGELTGEWELAPDKTGHK